MQQRHLGSSGLRVSRVGLGTMTWGRDTDEHESADQLRAFLEVGGTLLDWWHTGDTDWALVSAASLVYVAIAYMTKRSSWAVCGTIGFFAATVHILSSQAYTNVEPAPRSLTGGAPSVALACLGFWVVLLGLRGRRARQ